MGIFRRFGARIRRTRDGFTVHISDEERDLVAQLVPQLRDLLVATGGDPIADPTVRRLFPTAYPDDEERDVEYHSLTRDDLLARRLEHLEILERSARADRLTEEELHAWIGAVNDLRLVLGTRLDVSEDDTGEGIDEESPEQVPLAVYHYLGHLLGELVDAAAS
jgi:Domain of unknown function (DUF2017)